MSTFCGRLNEMELKYIAIDQFTIRNHDCSTFFLSHLHTDHMKGLLDVAFKTMLEENINKFLYCSEITKQFLVNLPKCLIPERKIKALPVGRPCVVTVESPDRENLNLTVTLVPAGHCPGSVMFMMEFDETVILYTGDFRVNPDDLKSFNQFHHEDGSVKHITSLYLDTTFAKRNFMMFPSRRQSCDALASEIENWIRGDVRNFAAVQTSARFGSEYLLIEVAKTLQRKIGVSRAMYESYYQFIPEMDLAVTPMTETVGRIHLCTGIVMHIGGSDLVRILYSCHCSLEELRQFMAYLKPKNTYPLVVPDQWSDDDVLREISVDILNYEKHALMDLELQERCTDQSLKKIRAEAISSIESAECGSSSGMASIMYPRSSVGDQSEQKYLLASPPRHFPIDVPIVIDCVAPAANRNTKQVSSVSTAFETTKEPFSETYFPSI